MLNIVMAFLATVVLSVTPVNGPAPLDTSLSIDVTGPYMGPVCVMITEGGLFVAGPFCLEDEVGDVRDVEVAAEWTETFTMNLVGDVPGSYQLTAFLPTCEQCESSNAVEVDVE